MLLFYEKIVLIERMSEEINLMKKSLITVIIIYSITQ